MKAGRGVRGGGGGRVNYNKEYLIKTFQSRVYMIRKSIVKHIFFGIYIFLDKKKLAIVTSKQRISKNTQLRVVMGISVTVLKTFFLG